jgi:4,5-DOPA dioxygenase extradiol
MSRALLPTVFISHGSPTTPLESIPAKEFWVELGVKYRNMKAVFCISAHWETARPAVDENDTIHDFYGFPPELYGMKYSAHGSSELAERVSNLLKKANMASDVVRQRGLDYGAWVPPMVMYPKQMCRLSSCPSNTTWTQRNTTHWVRRLLH